MIRGLATLLGIALVLVGLGDALIRLTIDGVFLVTALLGFVLVAGAWIETDETRQR